MRRKHLLRRDEKQTAWELGDQGMTPFAITISMVQNASATACQDVFLSDILKAIKACK